MPVIENETVLLYIEPASVYYETRVQADFEKDLAGKEIWEALFP